jgi:hypothetical protein
LNRIFDFMARPKTNPKMHRKNVALTLDPRTLSAAMGECRAQGYSLSATVDALLADWLMARQPGRARGPKRTTLGLATLLASIDDRWREDMGYTGRPVRREAYWLNMAKRLCEATQPTNQQNEKR